MCRTTAAALAKVAEAFRPQGAREGGGGAVAGAAGGDPAAGRNAAEGAEAIDKDRWEDALRALRNCAGVNGRACC